MISFKLEEEQEIARDALRDYAAGAIRPIARESDEASAIPEEFLAQSWELGLVSTQIPEAYGGGGEAQNHPRNDQAGAASQDLAEDVGVHGAEGHPDADLAAPLGDAECHDAVDAEHSKQRGDRGEAG